MLWHIQGLSVSVITSVVVVYSPAFVLKQRKENAACHLTKQPGRANCFVLELSCIGKLGKRGYP